MRRTDDEILDDISAAITSIHSHLRHGPISVEIVMDAMLKTGTLYEPRVPAVA